MKQNPDQPDLPMFQPAEMDGLFKELEAKELLLLAFGDAVYHAARLHENGIRDTREKIQALCIHPNVKHENFENGDEWDEYTCLVCKKQSKAPLK